jgi:hypothetical protein
MKATLGPSFVRVKGCSLLATLKLLGLTTEISSEITPIRNFIVLVV